HNHVDLLACAKLCKSAQTVSSSFQLFLIAAAALGIDANDLATQESGCLNPLVVVFDSLFSFRFVRVAQSAFTVNHNQPALDTKVIGSLLHIGKITPVAGFVLEELI